MIYAMIPLLAAPVMLSAVYVVAFALAFLTVDMPARAIFGMTEWWNGLLPLACVAVALAARCLALRFLAHARSRLNRVNPDA